MNLDLESVLARFEAAHPEQRNTGPFSIGACVRLACAWTRRDSLGSSRAPLASRLARAAGINDQEDDDNVLWRALHVLGVERGPQLRVISLPKDAGPTVALKAAMWRGLGPVHPYDLDAAPATWEGARGAFLDDLIAWSGRDDSVTLIVTSPLGDHGLLPAVCDRVRAAGKRVTVLFYSGRYNLRRAVADIRGVLGRADVYDVSRHPFLGGPGTPLDNMWAVHQACPGFAAFCEFANPSLAERSREFRAHFNRELLAVDGVFERSGPRRVPRPVLRRARELWAAVATGEGALDDYRAYLQRADVAPHLRPWKRSTVAGFERDAPIADACIALAVLLLRVAPHEVRLVRGRWRVQGGYSGVDPVTGDEAPNATAIELASPRDELFAVFIGLLAAARATFPDA